MNSLYNDFHKNYVREGDMADDEVTYFGLLLDLIRFDEQFPLHIIDLIGKKVLFSFIINNDETALEMIELNKEIIKDCKKNKESTCASM